jgi:hypothetical protein
LNVSLKDAWVFSKILAGQTLNGELDAVMDSRAADAGKGGAA